MFSSAVLLFLYEMFRLGSAQTEKEYCYSNAISVSSRAGDIMNLICASNEVIHLLCAFVIEDQAFQDKIDKFELIDSRCHSKSTCTVPVNSQSLSMESSSVQPSSLNVVYKCRRLLSIEIGEGNGTEIVCEKGIITVYSAIYDSYKKSNCKPVDQTSFVVDKCEDQPKCLVKNDYDHTQADPCFDIKTRTEVIYACRDCKVKFDREECFKSCNPGCFKQSCYLGSGNCNIGCIDGRFGEQCDKQCNVNCGGTTSTCDIHDGKCLFGCDAGYLGEMCDQECNANCGGADNTCDIRDGTCLFGCDAGYMGKMCDRECPDGYFGQNCSQECNINCGGTNNTCDKQNGECHFCDTGYLGTMCDEKLEVKTPLQYNYAAILAFAIFALLTLIAIWLIPKGIWMLIESEEDEEFMAQTSIHLVRSLSDCDIPSAEIRKVSKASISSLYPVPTYDDSTDLQPTDFKDDLHPSMSDFDISVESAIH